MPQHVKNFIFANQILCMYNMLRHFFIIFLFCFASKGMSQLKGFVYDQNNNQPLSEVIVYYSENRGRISDEQGKFNIPYSNNVIRFYKFGYDEVVFDDFREGDTVWMVLNVQRLKTAEIVTESVDLRKLLGDWLKRSSEAYFVDSSVYRAYSHRDEYLLDDSLISFIEFPKLYCNAQSKGVFGLNMPFSRPFFLPEDSLSGLFVEENALLRSSVGTIYEIKHHFPLLHSKDFVSRKTDVLMHNVDDVQTFRVKGIKNRYQNKEATLAFSLNDTLLAESVLWTASSENIINRLMKIQASTFMKGLSFEPPYSEWVRVRFTNIDGTYLVDEMDIRIEMSLVNKKTDEIYLLKRNAVFIRINVPVQTLNELELNDAIKYGGFIDPIFHKTYRRYMK